MKFAFAQIGITLALLQTSLTKHRCQQQNSKFPNSIAKDQPVYQESGKYDDKFMVKYKLSARQLTGRNNKGKMVKIDPYPIIYIGVNGNNRDPDVCFIKETQNPNWNREFNVTYESAGTLLKIDIWDDVESGNDFVLGRATVYVKNMLCVGRQIESPLWNHDTEENKRVDDFNTGIVIVRTTYVGNPAMIDCGE